MRMSTRRLRREGRIGLSRGIMAPCKIIASTLRPREVMSQFRIGSKLILLKCSTRIMEEMILSMIEITVQVKSVGLT